MVSELVSAWLNVVSWIVAEWVGWRGVVAGLISLPSPLSTPPHPTPLSPHLLVGGEDVGA